jgi:ceramide glucosyltransferase
LEEETYENFASFCRQDYPEYEILFGVADPENPAIPTIQKLIQDYPALPIRLLISRVKHGSNPKVSKLCHLVREARHDLLVISDSDIRAGPDCLRAIVPPFRDAHVGAVTCLYSGIAGSGVWSELEAINLTSDFLAGVLVARQLEGVKFALGATIAISRECLAEIGGFEALADALADDFQLGKRVAARGYRVDLLPYSVKTVCACRTARGFFEHHIRWAVVIRHSRPGGYLGLLLTQGLPWSVAAALAAPSRTVAAAYLGTYLLLRVGVTFTVGVWGLRDQVARQKWWLVPLRDALAFIIWFAGFFRNRIHWRGVEYYVREGRLIPTASRTGQG